MKTILVNVKVKPNVNIKIKNAMDWPKEYTCNFLEAGIVSYEDLKLGIAMLTKETIQKMLPSFIGKPVLIDHHDVTPETFKKKSVGVVTKVWFNDIDGWFYCSFILDDDDAKTLVANGYSVSCAFDVETTASGGEWHAIKYDEEITGGMFTHLALVDNPRYEGCKIYTNSKGSGKLTGQADKQENKKMFKFWAKSKENGKEKTTEFKRDPSNIMVDVDGEKVSVQTLLNAKAGASEETMTLQDEFTDSEGNKHSISDLADSYRNSKKKENSEIDEADKKKDNSKEDEDKDFKNAKDEDSEEKKNGKKSKKNESDIEEEDEEEEESKEEKKMDKKKNSKTSEKKEGHEMFEKVKGLRENSQGLEPMVHAESLSRRCARGAERYGKKVN